MKSVKFLKGLVFGLTIMCAVLGFTATSSEAKKPSLYKDPSYDFFVTGLDSYTRTYGSYESEIVIKNASRLSTIKDLKSSKDGIIDGLRYFKGFDKKICILFFPVKAGSTTISCKVKQNGKTYKLSKKITVYEGAPFKSVKVNKKEYVNNEYDRIDLFSMNNKKVKVKVTPKSGWIIKRMYTAHHISSDETIIKKIKNGSSFKSIGHTSVIVEAQNKKSKKIYHLLINLNPNSVK